MIHVIIIASFNYAMVGSNHRLKLRRLVLYPIELMAHISYYT